MPATVMRFFFVFFLALWFTAPCATAQAQSLSAYDAGRPAFSGIAGPDISSDYLKQARRYREEGRYELARQSYAQALSTCRSEKDLAVIKRELAGVELLLRTMR